MMRFEVVEFHDKIGNGLFRGSKPRGPMDLLGLPPLGIWTIISLEEGWSKIFGWRGEERAWSTICGRFFNYSMSNVFPPSRAECESVADRIEDNLKDGGVFVHCYAGLDRTGYTIAAYMTLKRGVPPGWAFKEFAIEPGMHRRYHWWRRQFMRDFGG